jgi:hypothetical protein
VNGEVCESTYTMNTTMPKTTSTDIITPTAMTTPSGPAMLYARCSRSTGKVERGRRGGEWGGRGCEQRDRGLLEHPERLKVNVGQPISLMPFVFHGECSASARQQHVGKECGGCWECGWFGRHSTSRHDRSVADAWGGSRVS